MLKVFVLSDVAADHAFDLTVLEQDSEAEVLNATVVRNYFEVFHLLIVQGLDKVLRRSAKTEPTDEKGLTILDILDSFGCTPVDLG